jgi:methionyl-tRNA formyltransferase
LIKCYSLISSFPANAIRKLSKGNKAIVARDERKVHRGKKMVYEKIEKLAEERGIQIRTLEKQLGFGNKTIKGWKKSSPSLKNIAKVAKFFGVTVDYFVER